MTKTFPVIFHNLKSYDSQLIMLENGKFDVKISVIPNGLEKYTAFTINNNSVFIDSMQCKYSSLDALVKNLSDNNLKHLSEGFTNEFLKSVRQKRVYPYGYMDRFEKFSAGKISDK